MFEICIFENYPFNLSIYMKRDKANKRLKFELSTDLIKAWEELYKTYEGVTYSVWEDDDCLCGGSYDFSDLEILKDNMCYKYFKIMEDGATIACIETESYITLSNVKEVLYSIGIKCGDIEKIIKIDKEEAYEWYEVSRY